MTVYTELLRDRLSRTGGARPVGALVAELLIRRARLVPPNREGPGSITLATQGSPERLADLLDYDESLVRLCDRLGLEHGMLEPFARAGARDEAERSLCRRVPLLAILEGAPAC